MACDENDKPTFLGFVACAHLLAEGEKTRMRVQNKTREGEGAREVRVKERTRARVREKAKKSERWGRGQGGEKRAIE